MESMNDNALGPEAMEAESRQLDGADLSTKRTTSAAEPCEAVDRARVEDAEARVQELETQEWRQAARIESLTAEQRVKAALIGELRTTNEALQLALSEAREVAALHEDRVGALMSSTSWRVTAPLRALASLVKGLRGLR